MKCKGRENIRLNCATGDNRAYSARKDTWTTRVVILEALWVFQSARGLAHSQDAKRGWVCDEAWECRRLFERTQNGILYSGTLQRCATKSGDTSPQSRT